jgi:DNA-binding NarL/FixJ family response regulator
VNDLGRTDSRARLLIVDEQPIVRHALLDVIGSTSHLIVCGEASTGAEAIERWATLLPDVAVVDLCLANPSGLQLLKEFSARTRVLLFSASSEVLYGERALNAGATGYVGKDEPIATVLQAIDAVLAGTAFISKRMTDPPSSRGGSSARAGGPRVAVLSERELEIFRMIGTGMGTREIAETLGRSRKTIETHRENIKRKLNVRSGTELVVRATSWLLEA